MKYAAQLELIRKYGGTLDYGWIISNRHFISPTIKDYLLAHDLIEIDKNGKVRVKWD